MLQLGTALPPFRLPRLGGREVSSDDFAAAPALLVVFICNHCPFVRHVRRGLGQLRARLQGARGLAIVGINSNDVDGYPDDGPDGMQRARRQCAGYTFPYLFDETQEVAKAYQAACTPDFFLFDRRAPARLSRPVRRQPARNGIPVTGATCAPPCDAVLAGQAVAAEQRPSIGCNIKWKPGNEPDYWSR